MGDAENQKKSDALKGLSKATAEAQLWRSKYETEGLGHVEELEAGRQKLSARLNEAEETLATLKLRLPPPKKTKHRLETELEDLQLEYERVHAAAIITERRGKNFDKVVSEWKAKSDDIAAEVDASQKECRNYNSELFRLKAAWDETMEQLDVVKRKIRILLMKSRTFLTNWEMEDVPFTSLTNNVVALKLKRKNFKLLLKKLKPPLNKKKTRFSELNLSLVKFVKRLTERSMRRKKSLTTPAKITNVPWTLCKLLWKPNLVQRPKLSVSRRSWNPISMS